VAELKAVELRRWLERLAAKPARVRTRRFAKAQAYRKSPATEDEKRARRATANRVLTILKAILNKAFADGLVADDTAWRQVKPFAKVDEPRIRFLTDAEAARLVNACKPDLRQLVRAALLTGARFGELVAMTVADVNLKTCQIYIARSKSGRPRHVPLNDEGVALFRDLVAGKTGEALVFQKADGSAWGKNHHVRLLAEACKAAKVRPAIAFHELRHTYASHLAQAGVDLLTISKLLGHADTRITSRHYAHLADRTLAQAVTKLPSFESAAGEDIKIVSRAQ
jgi:integrase